MNNQSSSKKWRIGILAVLLFLSSTSCVAQTETPERIHLEAYSRIESPARSEVSGIVKSRVHADIFWIHGDSGNEPNVFPINKNGEIASTGHSNGVELADIDNIDWEEIAVDDSGNLIVADIGNNCFCRENLSFLIFPEPDINQEVQTEYQRIRIQYPDKAKFFGLIGNNSPDAEAIFYKNGTIYLLTKEEDGEQTQLYKLESWGGDESAINTLTAVTSHNFDDKVTASDLSVTGDSLAILTSSSVWMFTGFTGEDFFSGTSKRVLFRANQVESVAFTGDESLIIAEEEGQLYEIPFSEFK